jgi:ankyrin repeat protein
LAVTNRDTTALRLLLDAGADACAINQRGVSVLHRAACEGAVEHMSMLLAAGARPDRRAADGSTLLHFAAGNGDAVAAVGLALALRVVDVGARDDALNTACHAALYACHYAAARALVEAGTDARASNQHGQSLLHLAVAEGALRKGAIDVPLVRLLARRGAPLHARDNSGRTPMHGAGGVGVEVLFALGADVNAHDDAVCTPIQLAGTRGLTLLTLLAAGAATLPRRPQRGVRTEVPCFASRADAVLWQAVGGAVMMNPAARAQRARVCVAVARAAAATAAEKSRL